MLARYRTVIDCDPGRDDALAILAALGSPALDVEFITTVAGNVAVERATENALRVLAVAGAGEIPVYQGARQPLTRGHTPGSPLYGDIGDDPPLPEPGRGPAGDADSALREWCRVPPSGRPKRLIAIGPLTNLGRLLRDDPGALRGVDDVFVMGGTVSRIATRVSPAAEFNVHTDPEAADLLLQSGRRIWLYDYDATTSCQIPVHSIDQIDARIGAPLGSYVAGWLSHLWEHANRPNGREGIAVHDLYAVAAAAGIAPGRWEHFRIRVDRSVTQRGTLISEPASASDPYAIAVARDLNPSAMTAFLIDSVRNLNLRAVVAAQQRDK